MHLVLPALKRPVSALVAVFGGRALCISGYRVRISWRSANSWRRLRENWSGFRVYLTMADVAKSLVTTTSSSRFVDPNLSRLARSMDHKTRSCRWNLIWGIPTGGLRRACIRWSSGRYATIKRSYWCRSPAVVTTTEREFVPRVKDGMAEWVDVKRGSAHGDLAEVLGPLAEQD